MATKAQSEIAKKNFQLWDDIAKSNNRREFIKRWRKSESFRLGEQWTKEESENLKANGMVDYVINRLRPAYRHEKAMIMSKRPTIKLTGVRSKHTGAATEMQRLINYIWEISGGLHQSQRMLDYYFDGGLGILGIFPDLEADYGRGELKIEEVAPDFLFIPNYARKLQYDDAVHMFYAKPISIDAALEKYGDKRGITREVLEKNAQTATEWFNDEEVLLGPNQDVISRDLRDIWGIDENTLLVMILEKTTKFKAPRELVKVKNNETGSIDIFIIEFGTDMNEFLATKGVTDYKIGDREETSVTRIRKEVTISEGIYVDTETLPISNHPYGFCVGEDTRNPFPVGDIHFNIGQQKLVNHLHSLILFIGQTMGVPHIIAKSSVFRNKTHKAEIQSNWAIPGYMPEFEVPANVPIGNAVQVIPGLAPSGIFMDLLSLNLGHIDHSTVNPLAMGDPTNAPVTDRATERIGQWADMVVQLPLISIAGCFTRVFNVLAEWMPNFYTIGKLFEYIEGEKLEEGSINMSQLESEDMLNDITNLEAKVHVTVGSHMSTSRISDQLAYKELAGIHPTFMKLFVRGIDNMDEDEKKEALEEIDLVPKLEQQIQQMTEYVEQLEEAIGKVDTDRLQAEERIKIEQLRGNLKVVLALARQAAKEKEERTKKEKKK